jgi:predicted nuclease of predicted toxin-antitoxin system
MKLLTDHDVYASTVLFLRGLGHDVVTVGERHKADASDSDLLSLARSEKRVLITRDRDYGSLVFVESLGTGVVYLRLLPSTLLTVHTELARVLTLYKEDELRETFIVVEPGRHRVRRTAKEED